MRRQNKSNPIEDIEQVAQTLAGFDYRVDPDDFILYELARLIDEDRATLDDEEFRRLIDAGIRQHVEENKPLRAELAGFFRNALPQMDAGARIVAERVIRAVES